MESSERKKDVLKRGNRQMKIGRIYWQFQLQEKNHYHEYINSSQNQIDVSRILEQENT